MNTKTTNAAKSANEVVNQFNQMFTLHLANTRTLREAVYHIRYQVYCEEKAMLHQNIQQLELDRYDEYSQHILIEHNRTGIYAGCARLVLPAQNEPPLSLPYEKSPLQDIETNRISPLPARYGKFGEISKVVVLPNFRRKAKKRTVNTNTTNYPNPQFSAQERIAFAHLNLGLIVASLSLAKINQLEGVFIFTDKRMSDYLKRIGLHLEQVGDPFSYQGAKSLFYLDKSNFTDNLGPDLAALFQHTHADLVSELTKYASKALNSD